MRIALFAYNFPHRKTQEFLLRLFVEGYDVKLVLVANSEQLKVTKTSIRVKPLFSALMETRDICKSFGWPCKVVKHNSNECADLLYSYHIDLGIISGARILKEPVLSIPKIGIINFHPGLIPQVRGLDALQWAILQNKPLGVTAHLIDKQIDAGRIILKEKILLQRDDTLIDVSLRMQDTEINMLPKTINTIQTSSDLNCFELAGKGGYNKKMTPEVEAEIASRFQQRIAAL